MKKTVPLYFILLMLCLSAYGAFASQPRHRHIGTSGQGMVKVKPDMAVVSMAVCAARKTPLQAKQVVDKRVNQFLKDLRDLGVRGADISASELVTRPQYEDKKHKHVLQDWLARRPLSITLRDLTHLNKLMNTALKAEVGQINDINLGVSNEQHYEHQALLRAIKDSKAKAHTLAKAYGASLGPIYSIDYNNSAPIRPMLRAASLMKQTTPGTYLAKRITFKQSVQVVFDLKIAR